MSAILIDTVMDRTGQDCYCTEWQECKDVKHQNPKPVSVMLQRQSEYYAKEHEAVCTLKQPV